MNDFDKIQNEIKNSNKSKAIENLAASSEAKRIGKMINGDELKKAAATGDKEKLTSILERVMNTEDGKKLLSEISENFKK